MSHANDFLRSSLLEQVSTLIRRSSQQSGRIAQADCFARQYLSGLPVGDLEGLGADKVLGIVNGLLDFAGMRQPGAPIIRVFDPDQEQHGWASPHTVVEIINDDMPFLVDSVSMVLTRLGLGIHELVHPILAVRRNTRGELQDVAPPTGSMAQESLMHIEVDRLAEADRAKLKDELTRALADVRVAVADWQPMRAGIEQVARDLRAGPTGVSAEEGHETVAFLEWLHDQHFTFLGYRCFSLESENVTFDTGNCLGLLRDEQARVFDDAPTMSSEIRTFLTRPGLLLVTKSSRLATVHRSTHMDVIGIKQLDASGKVVGLHAFMGLFAAQAYTLNPSVIPLVRRKVVQVQSRAAFPATSHHAKALSHILETYPRDELFQISEDALFDTALGILYLQERPRTALFVRRDEFERFVSCLIYVPRDRYDMQLRLEAMQLLAAAFKGTVDSFSTQITNAPLARLQVVIRSAVGGALPTPDLRELEKKIGDLSRSWGDRLQLALVQKHGEASGLALARRWRDAFPVSYRERHDINVTVSDIQRLESVLNGAELGLNLTRPNEAKEKEARLKLVQLGRTVPLSDVLPVLEAMGLRVIAEIPHEIRPADQKDVLWLHDYHLEVAVGTPVNLAERAPAFETALARIWRAEAESDGFNRLILAAGLDWRQVVVLRAYAKYLHQIRFPLGQSYLEDALSNNPAQAAALIGLFTAQFDPAAQGDAEAAKKADAKAAEALDGVTSADEDRILRRFLNLIRSTLRTNYYLEKSYLSFKLDSQTVEDLPLPRLLVEVFVYSPVMEGIHMRGGRVARGGIRWSDRREDFRTEVLGLVKAQMVKNTVIVPVGSKGGFVLKRPPIPSGAERPVQSRQEEGIEAYRTLIRGMLDVTDNLNGNTVVPPKNVVRRDKDDPYLVAAADKGTASFSNFANQVSADYGFWLGDAFASGGSKGYDHKGMGITARGTWEAVMRHFREMGRDSQTQEFTAVGVGSMAGDVFGNALLSSRFTRLVAAFSSTHIMIDPNPDLAISYAERERLFKEEKAWKDYDRATLSPGGGIYPRSAKSIPVSPEVKALFGLKVDSVTPNEMMRAILTAEVDLLYFGGIGTYVKATRESNADVGDRACDAIRVNGRELRAKVIGEGANLALTQFGRIEFGLNGGRLNTDAIDNSAGVDTSDHEVNIKILLNAIVAEGRMTGPQRDALLAEMTDEVAQLVLRDNYLQTQAISVMEAQGPALLDSQARIMRMLEKAGRLNRAIEFLPDEETLIQRASQNKGMTRPELAILLAYAKIWVYDTVLASGMDQDPFLTGDLARYFPTPIKQRLATDLPRHRLRREIIATAVTNSMINRVGVSFVAELMEQTGHGPADVAKAYIVARDAYGLRDVWAGIEALDGKVPASVQTAMLIEANRLLERATAWVLRNVHAPFDIGTVIAELQPGIAALEATIPAILPAPTAAVLSARIAEYTKQGVPQETASKVGSMIILASAADVVRISAKNRLSIKDAGLLYFSVSQRFGLGKLRAAAQEQAAHGHWQKLAAVASIEELYGHQSSITSAVIGEAPGMAAEQALEAWLNNPARKAIAERAEGMLAEISAASRIDLSMLMAANRQLKALI